jgi:hypothetical protein
MDGQLNPKIVGAFVIGFALVGAAYVLSDFGRPTGVYTSPPPPTEQTVAAVRTAIPVTDRDGNGIEDWRDEFVGVDPVVLNIAEGETYEIPTTITGQLGINFVQDVFRSRQLGVDDEITVDSTLAVLEAQTAKAIYDTPDVRVLRNSEPETLRAYANAVALAILENNESDLEYELLILRDAVNRRDEERLKELAELAEIYRLTRDAVIDVPVPNLLLKEHLDLINALHAIHYDIDGMTYAFDDPAYSLMRLKRYEGDIFGLLTALENMYTSLEPYAEIFEPSDPAVFFTSFNPTNRIRI